MNKVFLRVGLIMTLLTVPLLRADALTVQIQVGPSNIQTLPYRFDFTTKERDGMRQFGVTIIPKQGKLSPGLLARLHLFSGTTALATVPLEETREGNSVTYWFHLAPGLIESSRFEFDVLSGVEVKKANRKTRFIAEPGTIEYFFSLQDYVAPNAVAQKNIGPKDVVPAVRPAVKPQVVTSSDGLRYLRTNPSGTLGGNLEVR